jgi:hypothetical protein
MIKNCLYQPKTWNRIADIQRVITGQHSQDPQHLLQGQDLQEAHSPQGYPVQDW